LAVQFLKLFLRQAKLFAGLLRRSGRAEAGSERRTSDSCDGFLSFAQASNTTRQFVQQLSPQEWLRLELHVRRTSGGGKLFYADPGSQCSFAALLFAQTVLGSRE
jgi:hypothetical protein